MEQPGRPAQGSFRAFAEDERGAITTDIVLILLPILLIILTIFEIGISFYFVLAAQKAAQMGARFIIGETPLHSEVPDTYGVDYTKGERGDSCWVSSGAGPCLLTPAPTTIVGQDSDGADIVGWQCDGNALGAQCDAAAFNDLVSEMRIVYPSLETDKVIVNYTHEELGFAGGPFHPKVEVIIEARDSPVKILSLLDLVWQQTQNDSNLGPDPKVQIQGVNSASASGLRRVSASVFGGDNNSLNVR